MPNWFGDEKDSSLKVATITYEDQSIKVVHMTIRHIIEFTKAVKITITKDDWDSPSPIHSKFNNLYTDNIDKNHTLPLP